MTATTKKPGRPSKFSSINQEQLKKLVVVGLTDKQISDFFNINVDTLNEYKKKYPEFSVALKDWKVEADSKVEKCLYQRALGYEYNEVTYEKSNVGGLGMVLSGGEIESIKHENTAKTKIVVKQMAPDVTAQIFWLKNRQPAQWREKPPEAPDDDLKDTELTFTGVPMKNGKIPEQYARFLN